MFFSFLKICGVVILTVIHAILALLAVPISSSGNAYHAVSRSYARTILAICGVKVRIEGTDHINFSRNYIFVANHASYFDIPAVTLGLPTQIRIVYKRELEKIPFIGWALKYGKTYISIDRGRNQYAAESLDKAVTKIRNGASVILFAEGTRTSDGKLQPFKRGPFNLAVRAGVPIVPVTINGSFNILPRHSLKITPGIITLVLGHPITVPTANGRDTEIRLRDETYNIIESNYIAP